MTTLYLIRHGQASAGTDNYDRLSELGRQQSEMLGEWWQQTAFSTDASFSGDLARQQDTASIAKSTAQLEIPHSIHPDLNEYNHHHIDTHYGEGGKSDLPGSITFQDYLEIMDRWRQAGDSVPVGVETYRSFSTRGLRAVEQIAEKAQPGARLALFTSGGIIATIVGELLQLPFHRTMEAIWNIRNSSVTTIQYHGSRVVLVEFNTVAHLSVKSDPNIITLI